ncbi:hypothetical protein GW17_00047769, partial [Ensete ventricosum]
NPSLCPLTATIIVTPVQAAPLHAANSSPAHGRHLMSGRVQCLQAVPLWAGHGRRPCSLAMGKHRLLRAGHGRSPLLAALATYSCPYRCMAVVAHPLSLLPSLRKRSKNT